MTNFLGTLISTPFMQSMKFAMFLIAMVVVSITTIVYVYADSTYGQILPKDEPNFKPTISKGTFEGKDVHIIEFKSKIGT